MSCSSGFTLAFRVAEVWVSRVTALLLKAPSPFGAPTSVLRSLSVWKVSGERVWQVLVLLAAGGALPAKAADGDARFWCERAQSDDPGQ